MKTVWTVTTSAGVVAAVYLIFAGHATQAQGPAAPPRYGVVDLGEVMRQFTDVKEMQARLEKRAEAFRKEGQARQEKIEEIRFSRDQEHPDNPRWLELQKELNRLTVELELWSKFEKEDVKAETLDQQSVIYKRLLKAVETVAKQRGLDLVLHLDAVDLNDPNEVITAQRMTARAVVFSSPTVDLTKDVIARINQTSKKTKDAG